MIVVEREQFFSCLMARTREEDVSPLGYIFPTLSYEQYRVIFFLVAYIFMILVVNLSCHWGSKTNHNEGESLQDYIHTTCIYLRLVNNNYNLSDPRVLHNLKLKI